MPVKSLSVMAGGVAACAVVASDGLCAATIVVDDFEAGSIQLEDTTEDALPNPEQVESDLSPHVLGGVRELYLTLEDFGPGTGTSATATLASGGGEDGLTVTANVTTGTTSRAVARLRYNGGAEFPRPFDGLNLDLTDGGENDRILFDVTAAPETGASLRFYLYDDDSAGSWPIVVDLSGPGTYQLLFDSPNLPTSVLQDVAEIDVEIRILATDESASVTLREILVVPEPASLALLVLSSVGLMRRR